MKSAEKFVEKIAHGSLPPVPTIPNIPSLPSNMTSIGLSTPSTLSSDSPVVTSPAQPSTSNLSRSLATHLLPEPKRICTDSGVFSCSITVYVCMRERERERERESEREREREGEGEREKERESKRERERERERQTERSLRSSNN